MDQLKSFFAKIYQKPSSRFSATSGLEGRKKFAASLLKRPKHKQFRLVFVVGGGSQNVQGPIRGEEQQSFCISF